MTLYLPLKSMSLSQSLLSETCDDHHHNQGLLQAEISDGLQVDRRVHHIIDRDKPHTRRVDSSSKLCWSLVGFLDANADYEQRWCIHSISSISSF